MAYPLSNVRLIVVSGVVLVLLRSVSATTSNPCLAGNWLDPDNKCRPADPGWYVPHNAMTTEYPCPKGTFNNIYGATACCACCVGWYADQTTQTHCIQCANVVNPHNQNQMLQHGVSPAEATAASQCTYATSPTPMATCSQNPSACPNAGGSYASFGMDKRSPRHKKCRRLGYEECPVMHGRGGLECVDIMNDLESCGGCVGNANTSPFSSSRKIGTDCSALPGVNDVKCVQGQCVVGSCRSGYVISAKTGQCEPRGSGPNLAQYIIPHGHKHHNEHARAGHDL